MWGNPRLCLQYSARPPAYHLTNAKNTETMKQNIDFSQNGRRVATFNKKKKVQRNLVSFSNLLKQTNKSSFVPYFCEIIITLI